MKETEKAIFLSAFSEILAPKQLTQLRGIINKYVIPKLKEDKIIIIVNTKDKADIILTDKENAEIKFGNMPEVKDITFVKELLKDI